MRGTRTWLVQLAALGVCATVLSGPPALAQGGGASGQPAPTRQGLPSSPSPQGSRGQVEQRQRDAGVATPEERTQEQLRDLNAISKQLTPPGTPVPAPEVGTGR